MYYRYGDFKLLVARKVLFAIAVSSYLFAAVACAVSIGSARSV
jgi:hypothetical protein